MSTLNGGPRPFINTNGLVLNLDAGNPASYPGSGTTWTDLSGNGRNHTLINTSLTTYQGVSGFNCFPNGWITQNAGTTITFTQEYTMIVWGNAPSVENVTSWRTMLRMQISDHPLLIHPPGNEDADKIGYFDNNTGSFIYYGSTLAGIGQNDKWAMYTIVGTGGSTYLYYNNGNLVGSVPYSANGERHDTIGNVNNGSQPFGYIGSTMIYNRALSLREIYQNYYAQKSRFGL